MENLLALIVIIITIVSAITKAKNKQKPRQEAKAAASGDLAAKLKDFFTEVQQKFDPQRPKDASGGAGWGKLMPAESGPGAPEHYDMSLEDLELENEQAPASRQKKTPLRLTRFQAKPVKREVAVEPSKVRAEKKAISPDEVSPVFLRRAFVWSEILGPPVAMRDNHRDL